MGLREKVPVAPLDPDRLARIESAVLAEHQREVAALPRQRRRARWVRLAPAMAAACAALLVAGAVGWRIAATHDRTGDESATAPVPQVITGPGQTAHLDIGDASVSIGGHSRLAVHSFADGRITLDLGDGRVECDVTPRPHRPVFVVRAGPVAVTVVGTRFSVERHGDRVDVGVTRGKVRVTRADVGTVFVAAGESWSSTPELASAAPAARPHHTGDSTSPHPTTAAAAAAGHGPAVLQSAPGGGSRDDPAGPGASPATSTGASAHDDSAGAGPSPGTRATAPGHGPGSASGSSPHGAGPTPTTTAHPQAHRHGRARHPRIRHVKMPPGLPERTCSSLEDCEHIVVTTGGDEAARALYAWIYLTLAADRPGDALRLTHLYDRRFARRRPTEAAAVDTLRRLARTLAADE